MRAGPLLGAWSGGTLTGEVWSIRVGRGGACGTCRGVASWNHQLSQLVRQLSREAGGCAPRLHDSGSMIVLCISRVSTVTSPFVVLAELGRLLAALAHLDPAAAAPHVAVLTAASACVQYEELIQSAAASAVARLRGA